MGSQEVSVMVMEVLIPLLLTISTSTCKGSPTSRFPLEWNGRNYSLAEAKASPFCEMRFQAIVDGLEDCEMRDDIDRDFRVCIRPQVNALTCLYSNFVSMCIPPVEIRNSNHYAFTS